MEQEIDLDAPGVADLLSKQVLYDIDKAAVQLYSEPHPRAHLGASIIGKPCSRELWYNFRWVENVIHTGRQYRLFNRGHKEEERFTEWLMKAGYRVAELDDSTGKQWRVKSVNGHFSGSLDGKVWLPTEYNYSKPLLLEYKTNSTGAAFNMLIEKKCAIAKPVHFDQQCVYGYLDNLTHSLYLNVCKNDDNIHAEIIKLDLNRGKDLEKKAKTIIFSQVPLPRISENPAVSHCKFCDYLDICHQGRAAQKNCRSCHSAKPIEDAKWFCMHWNDTIPEHIIPQGCQEWKDITK